MTYRFVFRPILFLCQFISRLLYIAIYYRNLSIYTTQPLFKFPLYIIQESQKIAVLDCMAASSLHFPSLKSHHAAFGPSISPCLPLPILTFPLRFADLFFSALNAK